MEIRDHYFSTEQVIISEKRSMRPHDFVKEKINLPTEKKDENCPFCKGNEHMTPPTIVQTPKKNWEFRVFSNKFPLLTEGVKFTHKKSKLMKRMSGYGFHEVLVETPYHNEQWQHFKKKKFVEIFDMYKARYNNLINKPNIQHVMLFKNYGRAGGASLVHSHSQILATPFLPTKIMKDISKIADYTKTYFSCPFCDIVKKEIDGDRMVFENSKFITLSPFCARYPFELWILSKDHISDINDMDMVKFGDIVHKTIKAMFRSIGNFPFNMFVHHLPNRLEAEFHLHVGIQPRLKTEASVELGFGTKVNTIKPEKVAKILRS
jgi:UDPglucose--hexose-1-phosphate uridylyltransferase